MGIVVEILNIIAPIFLCSGIGFLWAKLNFGYETSFITRLVANIGFPCLIFSIISKNQTTEQIFREMSASAFISVLIFFIAGSIILKFLKLNQSTYLPSIALANSGNMGLPLCLFAFGPIGLAYGFAYFWVQVILVFLLGNAIASKQFNFKAIFRVPIIWAVIIAFVFDHFDLSLPRGINNTIELLGGFSIPLCLITLGASVANLKVNSLKRSIILSITRLAIGFVVGVFLSELLGFHGVARGVLIIQCTMPSAVLNFLFAEIHQNQPQEIAGIVLISTLCSFATLPILLWFVM
ncbi:MAG TPA: AEC family transporter [Rhodospirillales bacterium]|nr:AEC family transporter [Rhodospirillales bacterium]HIL75141.1 AEC family transporter [Rhodospirillales bacterium]